MVRPLPPPSAAAFRIDVADDVRAGGVLCLHGFTGSPYEVRVVANDLAERNKLAAYAPVLPGHEGDPAALNHLDDDAWLEAALRAYDHLDVIDPPANADDVRPRIVVGCSMGGLLALNLCLRRRVDAVVLLAPALRLFPAVSVAVSALRAGLWRVRPFIQKVGPGGDVGAVDAARRNPSYKVMPTRGLATFFGLQRRTEAVLSSVTTPLCTIHGARDHTIDPVSSSIIAAKVNSAVVEHHLLRQTQHLVGLDVDRDVVSHLACAFVARTLAAPSPSPSSSASAPKAS